MLLKKYAGKFPENVSFSWFMDRKGEVYRSMDGRTTLRFYEQGFSYFIKIHTGIGWREIVKNLVQFKWPVLGAKNEYLAIRRLTSLGIDTMTLVGYETKGWNPAKIKSFVVTEELTDTISLEDYCANWSESSPKFSEKQLLIRKVAQIAKKMHESGVNHRDFYICHFLMNKTVHVTHDVRLFLIDLHRAQLRSKIPERWLIKDLSALYFSAMHIGLTKRDIFRFIKIYGGCALRDCFEADAKLWNKVGQKAERLNRKIEGAK